MIEETGTVATVAAGFTLLLFKVKFATTSASKALLQFSSLAIHTDALASKPELLGDSLHRFQEINLDGFIDIFSLRGPSH